MLSSTSHLYCVVGISIWLKILLIRKKGPLQRAGIKAIVPTSRRGFSPVFLFSPQWFNRDRRKSIEMTRLPPPSFFNGIFCSIRKKFEGCQWRISNSHGPDDGQQWNINKKSQRDWNVETNATWLEATDDDLINVVNIVVVVVGRPKVALLYTLPPFQLHYEKQFA